MAALGISGTSSKGGKTFLVGCLRRKALLFYWEWKLLKKQLKEFPGGPVVRIWHFHRCSPGSIPSLETEIPHHAAAKKKKAAAVKSMDPSTVHNHPPHSRSWESYSQGNVKDRLSGLGDTRHNRGSGDSTEGAGWRERSHAEEAPAAGSPTPAAQLSFSRMPDCVCVWERQISCYHLQVEP